MRRTLDITFKDLLQLVRDRKTFLFLLIMPIAFTFLMGFASGGFSRSASDARLPVGFLDQDGTWMTRALRDLLESSQVIRLETYLFTTPELLTSLVADEKISAAVIIPPGYSATILHGDTARLIWIGEAGNSAGITIQGELISSANRLHGAAQTALVLEELAGDQAPFDYVFNEWLEAWKDPPIKIVESTSSAISSSPESVQSLAHLSPGMMLQFAVAGLLTAAQIMVTERKSRALQRMLTTTATRTNILFGHYLAILAMISIQFLILISFGNFILKVNYLRDPLATAVVAAGSALCIAALGLFIGSLAKTEEQAVIFSLVPMFLLAGLGGLWVPLEVTGTVFQSIGRLTPLAWAMDGFKNISIRGLGLSSTFLPVAALVAYAALFFLLAALQLQRSEEKQ